MESELSSVEEYDDSVGLMETSDEGAVDEDEIDIEEPYDEEPDIYPDEVEDEDEDIRHGKMEEEEEEEEEYYDPGVVKKTSNRVTKRKSKSKDNAIATPSRTSSRVRKHVDYGQNIDEDEFLEEPADHGVVTPKKRKSKIELVEDDEDEDDAADDELGNNQQGSLDLDEEESVQAQEAKSHRRSQMLENLIGLQAKKHGNRKEFTEEEMQLRKAETARKRKNFIEKRLEEEKRDVLNKLLKRRAAKTKTLHTDDADEKTAFVKPRRPYNASGLTRTSLTAQAITYSFDLP